MGTVKIIDPTKDSRWDKFSAGHPLGLICHHSRWKAVIEKSFRHMTGCYLALSDSQDEDLVAALPVFEVKSVLTGKRMVSMPFSSVCNPLVSDASQFKALLDAAITLFRESGADYLEVRSCGSEKSVTDDRLAQVANYKSHYLDLDRPLAEIWHGIRRNSIRTKISKAKRNGVEIVVGQNESDLRKFYGVHVKLRKSICRPVLPYRFFSNLWESFKPLDMVSVLLAEKGKETVGALLCYKFRDRVSAEFIGIDPLVRNLGVNNLLIWESVRLARSEGYRIFDFGRTSVMNKGLLDFKKRWGTHEQNLSDFYYPAAKAENIATLEQSRKFRWSVKVFEKTPEILYPGLGRFFYKHLG